MLKVLIVFNGLMKMECESVFMVSGVIVKINGEVCNFYRKYDFYLNVYR